MRSFAGRLHFLLKSERGGVIVLVALLIIVLLGMTALAVDVGLAYSSRRHLVNAADSAALAGAHDLPDASEAVTIANQYASLYGIAESETTVNTPYDGSPIKIEVEVTRTVPYTFARVLGFTHIDLSARAVATKIGAEGLRPIGIEKDAYDQIVGSTGNFIITKDNFGIIGAGNWGWVDLTVPHPPKNENPDKVQQEYYLKYGFERPIYIGDIITTDTGANVGGQVQDTDVADNEGLFVDVIIYIPIIEIEDGSGTSSAKVVGFAAIKITNYQEKHDAATSDFWIEATILDPADLEDPPDFITQNVVLIE